MERQKLEISRANKQDVLVLKDLYYNGTSVKELEKEQLLQALQEVTETYLVWKAVALKNKKIAEDWRTACISWEDLYYRARDMKRGY